MQKAREGYARLVEYLTSEVISYPLLKAILLPIFWEQLFLACLALFSIWLLRFDGENAMASVNMMALVTKTFTSLCLGLVTGATVLVAQNIGARRPEGAARSMVQTMACAVLLTAALGAALLWARRPMIGYLLGGVDAAVRGGAELYFTGFCAAFPFYALYQCFAGAMRGWGKGALAWRLTLSVNAAELALTALLLVGFKLGVLGVTLAMGASWTLGACVAVYFMYRERGALKIKRAFFKPDPAILRAMVIIALPLALEQFFFNGGRAVSQKYIAPYGTPHMSANALVNALFDIFNLPQITMREGLVTVVGMCVGCGRIDLARRYVYRFLRVIRRLLLASAPIAALLSLAVTSLFRLGPEAERLVLYCLAAVYVTGPFLLGGGLSIPAGLRAGGDAGFVSLATLACMWGVRVCFSWLFAGVMGLGVLGINLAMILDWIARGIIFRARLKGVGWYKRRLIVRS